MQLEKRKRLQSSFITYCVVIELYGFQDENRDEVHVFLEIDKTE